MKKNIFKRSIAFLLGVLLSFTCLDAGIMGTAPQAVEVQAATSTAKMTKLEKTMYSYLKKQIKKIASGKTRSTKIKMSQAVLDAHGSVPTSGNDLMELMSKPNIELVMSALLLDCPYEMFWYGRTSYCTYQKGVSGGRTKLTEMVVQMDVAGKYQGSGQYEVSKSAINAGKKAKKKADAIVAKYKNKSDYDKLAGYKQEICDLTEYDNDTAASGKDDGAYTMLNVFDGNASTKAVCEGYSKAFQYLCDKTSWKNTKIKCYSVTGYMSGGNHRWNIVTMDNGVNYMMDVTNCDGNSFGAPDKLFLAGASGSIGGGYKAYGVSYSYDAFTLKSVKRSILKVSGKAYDGEGGSDESSSESGSDSTGSDSGSDSAKSASTKPAQLKINSIEKLSGGFNIYWTMIKENCTGYELQVAQDKQFQTGLYKMDIPNVNANGTGVRSMSAGTYYVRMRAYNTAPAKTKYGKWSAVKTVQVEE